MSHQSTTKMYACEVLKLLAKHFFSFFKTFFFSKHPKTAFFHFKLQIFKVRELVKILMNSVNFKSTTLILKSKFL